MPKILQLEQHVADLIAAGEVVQRPASVVKELIENSIDSGASIITVEISSGGMTYIRVTDNGCGIDSEDAETAFLRHATSKLRDAQGLEAIGTLGFRGEALAAIAAVSRIELLTRTPDADEGLLMTLEAGEVVSTSPAGCPEGTTIIVRDLFFNTPARLKFMKSDRAEGSSVAAVVLRCALSRPDVSIRFIKDGKTEYHTPGDSRVDSCIYSLLGREIESGFLVAESSDETVAVEGFVSKPSAARGNRSYQFFFVNGRVIRSLLLQSALEQAYKNILPSGRFPSCVLYITTKPSTVDVNVHPAKTEIKFFSDKQIFDAVYYSAMGALERREVSLDASSLDGALSGVGFDRGRPGTVAPTRGVSLDGAVFGSNSDASAGLGVKKGVAKGGGGFSSMDADEFQKKYGLGVSGVGFDSGRQVAAPTEDVSVLQVGEFRNEYHSDNSAMSPSSLGVSWHGLPAHLLTPHPFRVIGEALNVYIIVEANDSVWFIDKHAAHERLRFDALRSSDYEPMSESLITPVICRLGHEDASLLLDNAEFLDDLGFSVESFGEDAVAIRHIPSEIDIGDTESVLSDICSQLRHSGVAEPVKRDSIYKTIACKAAIKAGSSSDIRELESLAEKVMSGEVSECPHGRPVAFEITKATLDKGFGRG